MEGKRSASMLKARVIAELCHHRLVADLMALFTGFEVNFGTESPFVPNPPLSEAIWTGKQYVFEVSVCALLSVCSALTLLHCQAVCPSYNASECIGDQPRPY